MTFTGITVDSALLEHRARLASNRPDRPDAITAETAREMNNAVAEAITDDSVRDIVIPPDCGGEIPGADENAAAPGRTSR